MFEQEKTEKTEKNILTQFRSPFTPLPPVQFRKIMADNSAKRARLGDSQTT
jgi:hypothetical protein